MKPSLKLSHILSTNQFLDPKVLSEIFATASKIEKQEKAGTLKPVLAGKIIATLFYEPSTRTRFSFEGSMLKLGGDVITTENAGEFSSAIKGETIQDTIRIVANYVDAIVMRHNIEGSAKIAASVSPVPIINAGDGAGEHPTQALLDMYTIKKELGKIEGLKIAVAGDLLYGRASRSLIHLLSAYKNQITLVSPPQLKFPEGHKKMFGNGMKFAESTDLREVASQVDVLYMTRIQKERFSNLADYEKLKGSYVLNMDIVKTMQKHAIIMHPLPRVDEITPDVDNDPRAAYFREAKNGLYIRMALLQSILSGK
jgi:aspartate carbamoyltransferase catalytic subunit